MAIDCNVRPVIGAQLDGSRVDEAVAALAERQHGVVARAQLTALGVGRRAVGHRLERGRLHPLHRGVYAVGHRVLSPDGRWMAAVLAAGPGAVLSHRSAAALWELRPTARSRAEITVAHRRRTRRGIELHTSSLAADEITTARGIPVTSVPRTLIDLAAVVPAHQLERALHEAELRRLTDELSVEDVLARHQHRRGVAAVRAILVSARLGTQVTRSELEDRFLAFLDEVGLPRPQINRSVRVQGRWLELDCVWPEQRLVVELDGYWAHGTRRAYERDRRRDRALQAAGWRVVRITWRQLHEAPTALAADLHALLA